MNRISCFLALALLLAVSAAMPATGSRVMLLQIDQPAVAWGDSHLFERLAEKYTRESGLQVVETRLNAGAPASIIDSDSLIRWGREQGGAFLLTVTIQSERIERHKSFQVPLVFHKWETVGIIEGEYRLFDLQRGRVLAAEPFEIEVNGPRVFQGTMDDNKDDPDIHLRAPDKLAFLARIEETLATKIVKQTRPLIRIQSRELYTQKDKKG
ncbi:MAG TPA: hypothetical protein VMS71_03915 [Candidatus Acidoferrum sp.]|nr:hypothetical protein [Candidatus Acidoferrum sp.]